MTPKSQNGGAHENARRPRAPDMQDCYKPKATCPRPALVLPEPYSLLLSKVRVLKASTKNPGLTPLTPLTDTVT